MNEEVEIDKLIDDLVAMGALVKGEPVDGEPIYNVVSDRMQEVMPSFYDMFMQEVEATMLDLYEKGLVNIEYDENLKARYSLTEEGEKVVDQIILSEHPYDM